MNDVYSILEINKIIDLIKKNLKTKPGNDLLSTIKVFPTKEILIKELEKLKEMYALITEFSDLPLSSEISMKEVLEYAKKGSYLDEATLNKIKNEIFYTFELIKFFNKINLSVPILKRISSRLVFLESIYSKISQKISSENKVYDGASKKLKEIRTKIDLIDKEIHKQIISLSNYYHDFLVNDSYVLRNGHFALAINSSDKNKVDGIIHDISDSGQTTFVEPTIIVNLENQRQVLTIQEKDEVNRILRELTNECIDNESVLIANNKIIGQFDLLSAKVKYGIEYDAIIPTISDKQEVFLIKARHPLLEKSIVVPNDFIMNEEHPMMLISGPNAGGKTVALKTVATLSLLIKYAIPITASPDSRIAFFKNIWASIGDNQSIESNLSTFSSHINELSVILKYISSKDLVIIDELGSGTDPKEGDALSVAIAKYLLQKKCITMITSHFPLLKKYGLSNSKIINASFLFNQDILEPTFKMLLGVSGKSYGFLIAKKFGLPQDIIFDAKKIYNKNYNSEIDIKIDDLDSKEQELLRKEEILKGKEFEIRNKISELNAKEKLLDEKENKLKERKIEEFDELIDSKIDELNEIYNNFINVKDKKSLKEAENKLNNLSLYKKKTEKLNVGDFVYVKSLNAKGKIIRINGNKISFNDDSGFTLTTNEENCEKIDPPTEKLISTRNIDSELENLKPLAQSLNLVGYHIDEGLEKLDEYLDACTLRKYKEVKIIHGYGSGQLRNAIHNYLKKSPYVASFKLGDESYGGSGVTVVKLK